MIEQMARYKRKTWYPYDYKLQANQILPRMKKYVLMFFEATEWKAPLVSVGFFRHPSGVKQEVLHTAPGACRMEDPVAWNDCLPKKFLAGAWINVVKQAANNAEVELQ